MVVYELKDVKPLPQFVEKEHKRRQVKPISPVSMARPLDFLTLSRQWGQGKGNDRREQEKISPEGSFAVAQTVIGLINDHLETVGIAIHLALFKGEDGYRLNVYDCVNKDYCRKVAEEPVNLSELPDLLRRLKQQSGILLDTRL